MNTENKPLLSDNQYRVLSDRMIEEHHKYENALMPGHWAEIAARKVASHMNEFLQSDRAKTREVVQRLVDMIFHDSDCGQIMHNGKCDCFASVMLSLAKTELGIEPTPTKP